MTDKTYRRALEIESIIKTNGEKLTAIDSLLELIKTDICCLSVSALDDNRNVSKWRNAEVPSSFVKEMLCKYVESIIDENVNLRQEFFNL